MNLLNIFEMALRRKTEEYLSKNYEMYDENDIRLMMDTEAKAIIENLVEEHFKE